MFGLINKNKLSDEQISFIERKLFEEKRRRD